jgi:hypothetical protein
LSQNQTRTTLTEAKPTIPITYKQLVTTSVEKMDPELASERRGREMDGRSEIAGEHGVC